MYSKEVVLEDVRVRTGIGAEVNIEWSAELTETPAVDVRGSGALNIHFLTHSILFKP